MSATEMTPFTWYGLVISATGFAIMVGIGVAMLMGKVFSPQVVVPVGIFAMFSFIFPLVVIFTD